MWASAWVQILDLITLAFGPWASYLALWTSFSKSELNNRLFLTRCHEKRVEHAHQVPRRVSCRQTCPPDGKRSSLRAGISAAFSPPHTPPPSPTPHASATSMLGWEAFSLKPSPSSTPSLSSRMDRSQAQCQFSSPSFSGPHLKSFFSWRILSTAPVSTLGSFSSSLPCSLSLPLT